MKHHGAGKFPMFLMDKFLFLDRQHTVSGQGLSFLMFRPKGTTLIVDGFQECITLSVVFVGDLVILLL